jgi:hypothetical protein
VAFSAGLLAQLPMLKTSTVSSRQLSPLSMAMVRPVRGFYAGANCVECKPVYGV